MIGTIVDVFLNVNLIFMPENVFLTNQNPHDAGECGPRELMIWRQISGSN